MVGKITLSDGCSFANPSTDGNVVTLLQAQEEQVFRFRSVCRISADEFVGFFCYAGINGLCTLEFVNGSYNDTKKIYVVNERSKNKS